MDVDALIDELIEREGGYVAHPADRGGPTRYGITEAVARAHGYSGPKARLPRDEAAAIYRRLYWLRPRFDQVAERAPRVAAELFDTGANMGPAVAATFQPGVGGCSVMADGTFGAGGLSTMTPVSADGSPAAAGAPRASSRSRARAKPGAAARARL